MPPFDALGSSLGSCNATTEGPNSLCVNAIVNSIDNFCIYGE